MPEYMSKDNEEYEDELQHVGVLGMHWGTHRNKAKAADHAKIKADIKVGASHIKSTLSKIGNRLYANSPIKNKKAAALVDLALTSALVGGMVLAQKHFPYSGTKRLTVGPKLLTGG